MVTVLLFAGIAEKLGTRRFEIEVGEGETVGSVRDRLFDEYPELKPYGETLLFAVDEEYAQPGTPLPDGATLALIPPVSGG